MSALSTNDILRKCALFQGLADERISGALQFFKATRKHYQKGEYLLREGSPVSRFAVVLSGNVQVFSDDFEGNQMMMASVQPGETFGESLCYLRAAESPVYAVCAESCDVYWLSTDFLFSSEGFGYNEYSHRFIEMLAHKTLSMNDRVQVLSKPLLRQRLLTLFSQYAARNGRAFDLPFDRNGMAVYLGVNRTALSRELAQMVKEDLIEFQKNHFILHSENSK